MTRRQLNTSSVFRIALILILAISFPQTLLAQGQFPSPSVSPEFFDQALLMPIGPTPEMPEVNGNEAATSFAPLPAVQTWLYAVDLGTEDNSSTLYRMGTTASGGFVDLTTVGETGVKDIFDIAFIGSRLFAVANGRATFGTTLDVLLELNPATGTATPIGTINAGGGLNALVGETPTTLLAASTTGEVWRIDPFAPTADRIGSFGTSTGSSGDLAFGLDGTLYGTLVASPSDRLVRVNKTTGSATVIGQIGFDDVYGLAVDPNNGILLAVVSGPSQPRLATINKISGAATIIGRIPAANISGLATVSPPTGGGLCAPSTTSLCLSGGRFRVRVEWTSPTGSSGQGQAVDFAPARADSGAFWFFNSNNVEMVVKVLNACAINNRFWVFAGGLTNVQTHLIVDDTATGITHTYDNPQGTPFQPVQDTGAFATCP